MKIKLNVLILLSTLAAIGVITLQVSWLQASYQIAREKIKIEGDVKLDQAILKQKKLAAEKISSMMIKGIKSNANLYIKINNKGDAYEIGYDGPNGKIWKIPPIFSLTDEEAIEAKNDSYNFLLKRIKRADIKELKDILDNAIGPYYLHIPIRKLYESFGFYSDTVTLNKFLGNASVDNSLTYKAKYYEDINHLYDILPIEHHDQTISNYDLPFGEKLASIEKCLNKVNKMGSLICIVKPIFNNDNLLSNQVPVILLTIEASKIQILSKMLFSLIGSVALFILFGFCLIYMFYTILKQKRLSEIKDDFISNVSHELKTPVATTLAAIQGMQHFDVLKDQGKTEQYLGTAAKEMKRLSTMIDTILNSAIYERSDFELHKVTFNLKEMLGEIIHIQESHSKKEVKIELNYLAKEDVFADKTHLYNVFTNLIDNAIKYGNERVGIKIGCSNSDTGIKIQIEDNGRGIPAIYQKNIFDKFFRVPSPTDHSIKGHGLGLNYVKNIIRKHNGTIDLLKSDDKGSTFEINLPQ